MALTRRAFFTALLAVIAPKGKALKREFPRPVPLPESYIERRFRERISLHRLNQVYAECWFGNSYPKVITVSPHLWRKIWNSIQIRYRLVETETELAKAGWPTFRFNGGEVAVDMNLQDGEVWMLTPGKGRKYNARVMFDLEVRHSTL